MSFLSSNSPQSKILVADDSRINRLLLSKVLALANVDIQEVKNGLEAVEVWRSWQPDLIFMDLLMPEMTGEVAIEKIRQAPQGGKVIIIACTASLQMAENQDIDVFGADYVLRKPFRTEEIFALLRKYLKVTAIHSKV
ncbi:response regulator [[Limnothrix rosea] IAM M-220]|uniref:response regulator n=1 Tax=[Limnothrix rosea] IAM M-220 TaxID=454133 RepID=UPI001C0DF52B|nr:response regulator [[Limnothrix rosea] IAM M-220]